jgi:hypothetical protein
VLPACSRRCLRTAAGSVHHAAPTPPTPLLRTARPRAGSHATSHPQHICIQYVHLHMTLSLLLLYALTCSLCAHPALLFCAYPLRTSVTSGPRKALATIAAFAELPFRAEQAHRWPWRSTHGADLRVRSELEGAFLATPASALRAPVLTPFQGVRLEAAPAVRHDQVSTPRVTGSPRRHAAGHGEGGRARAKRATGLPGITPATSRRPLRTTGITRRHPRPPLQ